MTLKVISAGFGRTGTMSLKLALEQLGFGPCYHMIEVIRNNARQVPLWQAALEGKADFDAIFAGYQSAVDWPVAAVWRELADAFPEAKIILSTRSAESWFNSMAETILAQDEPGEDWPPAAIEWSGMVGQVLARSFGGAMDRDGIIAAFHAHEAEVKAAIPAERLLVHQAKDGWGPLCAHLGVPVPDTPYPRTNSKDEFFEFMKEVGNMAAG